VNVGSALTPIDPQNLSLAALAYLFPHFLTGMAPLVSVLGSLLLSGGRRLSPHADYGTGADAPPPINTRLLLLSLVPVRAVCSFDRMAISPPGPRL